MRLMSVRVLVLISVVIILIGCIIINKIVSYPTVSKGGEVVEEVQQEVIEEVIGLEKPSGDATLEEHKRWVQEAILGKNNYTTLDVENHIASIDNEEWRSELDEEYQVCLKQLYKKIDEKNNEDIKRKISEAERERELERERIEKERTEREKELAKLANKEPSIGMSEEDLNACAWAKDLEKVNETITAYGISKQYCYDGYRYVYVEDGVVTTIQK